MTTTRPRTSVDVRAQRAKERRAVDAETRRAVFRRDGWRCRDCHRKRAESRLEVDHIIPIGDGGRSTMNNLQTLCKKPCHERKSAGESRARNAGIPTDGDAPTGADLARWSARTYTGCAVGLAAGWAWLDRVPPGTAGEWWVDVTASAPEVFVAATAACAAPVAVWKWRCRRVDRAITDQLVRERITTITGLPLNDRKSARVTRWENGHPTEVVLRLPPGMVGMDPDDRQVWLQIIAAAADPLGVDPDRVQVQRRGKDTVLTVVAVDTAGGTPAASTPVGEWEAAVAEALDPILGDGLTVEATDMDRDQPTTVVIRYPLRAASKATRAATPVLTTMRETFPPPGRAWFITVDHPNRVIRLTARPDPLAAGVPLPPVDPNPDLYRGVTLGMTDRNDLWLVPLAGPAAHMFIAGATGSGKGSIEWSLIRQLGPMIRDGRVRLWLIDPKMGAELGPARPLAPGRFARTKKEADRLLERFRAAVDAKYEQMEATGRRRVETFTRDEPFDLLLIDEAADLYADGDKKRLELTEGIINVSRAAGAAVWAFTQSALKESFPPRDLMPRRLALRLPQANHVDPVLGVGAKDGGALAWTIPETMQGTGYMVLDGRVHDPVRVRSAFVDDNEIARIVALYTPEGAAPPTRPVPAGTQPALIPPAPPPAPGVSLTWDQVNTRLPARVYLPDDPDPVTVLELVPDPDDEDTRVEVTYRYDGETGRRVCAFDNDVTVTTIDPPG